jgi:hypothetical protein
MKVELRRGSGPPAKEEASAQIEGEVLTDDNSSEVLEPERTEGQERHHEAVAIVHGIEARIMRGSRLPCGHEFLPELKQCKRGDESRPLVADRPSLRRQPTEGELKQSALGFGSMAAMALDRCRSCVSTVLEPARAQRLAM